MFLALLFGSQVVACFLTFALVGPCVVFVPLHVLSPRHQAVKQQHDGQGDEGHGDAVGDGDVLDGLQDGHQQEVRVGEARELLQQEAREEVVPCVPAPAATAAAFVISSGTSPRSAALLGMCHYCTLVCAILATKCTAAAIKSTATQTGSISCVGPAIPQ